MYICSLFSIKQKPFHFTAKILVIFFFLKRIQLRLNKLTHTDDDDGSRRRHDYDDDEDNEYENDFIFFLFFVN